jgi:hypothetical protein
MSKTFHHGERRHGQRPIRVRGVRREPADLRKLARALIAFAQAQAEAEAEAEAQAQASHDPTTDPKASLHDRKPASEKTHDEQGDAA